MKILMLLSNPFVVDPRVHKEAKALVDAGHEVTVVVWDRRGDYEPEDVVDGIRLVRLHNTGLMRVLPHDLLRNPVWWRRAYKKGLELYRDGYEFDVVHCHDLDTLQAGVWLKKKLGCKLVYDAHEVFGYMIAIDVPDIIIKLTFLFEKTIIKAADEVITVTEPCKEYFTSITDSPVTTVLNCKNVISSEYHPPHEKKSFLLSYIGILHRKRFFPEIVDIIGGMENSELEIAAKKENIDLYNIVKHKAEQFDNVTFLGPISYDEVLERTFKSDAIICLLDPARPSARFGLQNKIFESMATGRPVIVAEGNYAAEFVEKNNCGVITEYSEEGLKKAILMLQQNPDMCKKLGKQGLQRAVSTYNWGKQKEKLLEIYWRLGK